MQAHDIEKLIKQGLQEADVYVEGDGTHFSALVVSTLFSGKSRLERQQMIYDTVNELLLNGTLHALSTKALTPDEWKIIEQNEKGQK